MLTARRWPSGPLPRGRAPRCREGGRPGSAAWEYHAYRMMRDGSPVDHARIAIQIEVQVAGEGQEGRCLIRPDAAATSLVSPLPARWRALCTAHGEPMDVQVVPPP